MHPHTINIHIGGRPGISEAAMIGAILSTLTTDTPSVRAAACAAPSPQDAPPPIGSYWTGQGGIYAGMGRGYDGKPDHHLIVLDPAPTKPKRAIGTYGVDVEGADSDHDGMANTIALANAGSELCAEILQLEVDGHKDFYLLSRSDARLCMANVPELFEKDWYWTSTQYSSDTAWIQGFYDGGQGYDGKKSELLFRPVRRLIL